ncbi:MAG TPA: desaturase, partial [Burkholderiaceae bacterium]
EAAPVECIAARADRRATFRCTAGVVRPGMAVAPGLLAAGDYVDGPYPATLEAAVRAGEAAVEASPSR